MPFADFASGDSCGKYMENKQMENEQDKIYIPKIDEELWLEGEDLVADISDTCAAELIEKIIGTKIPIISTAVHIYRMGHSLMDFFNLKKLAVFIENVDNGILDDEREKYLKTYENNKEKFNEQISYLMLILEKYMSSQKAKFLSQIYVAFLRKQITWLEVCKYAETIERFLLGDYEILIKSATYRTIYDQETDAIQRLIALGLVIEEIRKSNAKYEGGTVIIDDPKDMERRERSYIRTEYGTKLVGILKDE